MWLLVHPQTGSSPNVEHTERIKAERSSDSARTWRCVTALGSEDASTHIKDHQMVSFSSAYILVQYCG